jgi:hypothetical protein
MRAAAVPLAPPAVSDLASRATRVLALSTVLCPAVGALVGAAVYVAMGAVMDGSLGWLAVYGEVALLAFLTVWRFGLAAGLAAGVLAMALALVGGRGRSGGQWCAWGAIAGAPLGAFAPVALGVTSSGDPAVLGFYLAAGVASGALAGALVGVYAWRELSGPAGGHALRSPRPRG